MELEKNLRRQMLDVLIENGLKPDSHQFREFNKNRFVLGNNIKKSIVFELIESNIHSLDPHEKDKIMKISSLSPSVLAFGYDMGVNTYRLLHGNSAYFDYIGNLNAIYNASISLFDSICDNKPNLFMKLREEFTVESVIKAMGDKEFILPFQEIVEKDKNSYMLLTWRILAQYFTDQCRHLNRISGRENIYEILAENILNLYTAECNTFHMNINGTIPSPLFMRILEEKTALNFWTFFLISFLAPNTDISILSNNLKVTVINLGKAFLIADDLADFIKDGRSGKWNTILITAFLEDKEINEKINHKIIYLTDFLENPTKNEVIHRSCIEMCRLFMDSLDDLEKFSDSNVVAYRNMLTNYLYSWIAQM